MAINQPLRLLGGMRMQRVYPVHSVYVCQPRVLLFGVRVGGTRHCTTAGAGATRQAWLQVLRAQGEEDVPGGEPFWENPALPR